jgi:uncharacterized phage protein (TIGR02218 family)
MSTSALLAHLESGLTTVARCWSLERSDGVVQGFTDHDLDLSFDGIVFRASSGLTARALMQTTGLAVDNSEAIGALQSDVISEADIIAGRYDNAAVVGWLVNWSDVSERYVQFRGNLGEITRAGGAFSAEMRGLTEALNQPQGRVFQKPCSAILGDASCTVDLNNPAYSVTATVTDMNGDKQVVLPELSQFTAGDFTQGVMQVETGSAQGLKALIKDDNSAPGVRVVTLWQGLNADLEAGDQVKLSVGCDKRASTCRAKFNNFINYRGFPHIPGQDWLMSYPVKSGSNTGGALKGDA